jgi:imidazoleglycerol-phosphate dehydratase
MPSYKTRKIIPRVAQVDRQTRETSVHVSLALDGSGKTDIHTGIGFLDHMLAQLAMHGLFDLSLTASGDLDVDCHHTMEDVALSLGMAFQQALGEHKGIVRTASAFVPMDESLALGVVDFSGRPYAVVQVRWNGPSVGGAPAIPTSLFNHFLESFTSQARCNLHVHLLYGQDDHHQAEAIFKVLGRALDAATRIDSRRAGGIPSTKGVLRVCAEEP